MTRRPAQLPSHVEQDVAERLARALHGGPADLVDVTALAAGTRRGIVRASVRRRATVLSAAVAAVAVPVGVMLLGPGGATRVVGPAASASSPVTASATGSPTASAAPSPSESPGGSPSQSQSGSPAGSPTTSPADPAPSEPGTGSDSDPVPPDPQASVVPIGSLSDDPVPNHVAYLVPDAVTLVADSDFPRPMLQLLDLGDYRWTPTVSGQGCGGSHSPMPVAARQWGFAEENSNRLDQLSVNVVVSGWRPGTTAARFADIRQNDGVCRFSGRTTTVSTAGLPGDEAWAATLVENGYPSGRAAIRVGDVIVSVEVDHPDGKAAAVSLAKTLAGLLAERAVSSGLAATAAAGG